MGCEWVLSGQARWGILMRCCGHGCNWDGLCGGEVRYPAGTGKVHHRRCQKQSSGTVVYSELGRSKAGKRGGGKHA